MPTPLNSRPWLIATAALALFAAGSLPLVAAPPSPTAPAQKEAGKDKSAKKARYKSQAESAAKSVAFVTVSETDKSVTGAVRATDLEGIKRLTGKPGTVTGTVTEVFAPKSNNMVILNFAADYHTAMTAVVRQRSFSAFPALSSLEGKKVVITGTVADYQGRPEIELTGPSQIKLLK